MDSMLANFEAIEDSGTATHTLTRKSRKLVITNDSSSIDLKYKFNVTEAFGTLQPTESISLYFTTNTVIVEGLGAYRIWSYG